MNIRSLLTVVFIAFISCNNQKDLNRSIVINNCETVTLFPGSRHHWRNTSYYKA